MANLTGSPLGLTNLTSEGNLISEAYNSGLKQTTDIIGRDGNTLDERISLFTGGAMQKFWANTNNTGTDQDSTGLNNIYNGINRSDLHNDSVYDTSITNIIDKLEPCPKARLKPLDFAYLKNLGVYPNNRLMIARRFITPAKDNIMDKKGVPPRSVLISWKSETENFLDFSFGEEWESVNSADFTQVLNGVGGKLLGNKIGSKIGNYLGSGGNSVPLPGFTELAQREFFEKIGILEKGSSNDILPSGNPNIIKEAKKRKVVGYGEASSG